MSVVDSHAQTTTGADGLDAVEGASPSESDRWANLRHVGDLCSLATLMVAVSVLVGWSVGNQTLIRLVPGLVAMNPLTGVCFIMASLALMIRSRHSSIGPWISAPLGSLVVLVGALRLVGDLGWYLPLDRLLFTSHLDQGAASPDRMPQSTALTFCLAGAAIVALVFRRYRASQVLALGTAFTAAIALIGYAYSVASFGEVAPFIPMALHTSVLFVLIATAVVAGSPKHGLLAALGRRSAGGRALRRLLPGLWLGPPVLGWLRLQGEWIGLFTPAVGVALFAAATIVLGTGLAWLTASAVDRGEAERRRAEEIMRRLAHFDKLTGLPNRSLLEDRAQQSLMRAERSNARVALMFLDLDGFKQVNDRLGHEVGDRVLREAARRIQAAVRAVDTAARLGGDEFVVVLEQVRSESEIRIVADRVVRSLSEPYDGVSSALSVSVGVSVYPEDARTLAELLASADAAMYRAKADGKARVAFHPALNGDA